MLKTGNKSDCMKMYRDEKTQGLHRSILFVELFANVKRFGFQTFIRAYKLLNETKEMRKLGKLHFHW